MRTEQTSGCYAEQLAARCEDRRETRRFFPDWSDGLRCNLGRVVDFSHRGMRLRCNRLFRSWRVGVVRRVVLSADGESVEVDGRCVWARREGFGRDVVGVSFGETSAETTRLLKDFVSRYGIDARSYRGSAA